MGKLLKSTFFTVAIAAEPDGQFLACCIEHPEFRMASTGVLFTDFSWKSSNVMGRGNAAILTM